MIRYTFRRLLLLIPQLLGVMLVTFIIVRAIPGNPAQAQLGTLVSQDAVVRFQKLLGLDQPLYVQFFHYLGNVMRGNLGESYLTGRPVVEDLLQRVPSTLELITIGFVGSLVIAIPLGVVTAVRTSGWIGRVLDKFSFGYGLMAGAIPDFWFALILIYVFFYVLHLASAPIGQLSLDIPPPGRITGMLLVDSTLTGNWRAVQDALGHLALPVLTLVFINAAPVLRMTRNTVLGVMTSDFVRFAKANGLPNRDVIRYALRNSLSPILTLAGVLYTILIAGAVLTETIFSWGGVGQYAVQSIVNADWAAVQGVVLFTAALSLVLYLALDLVQALVDPRIRY